MSRVRVTDEVSLYCQDVGEGQPVVLLHGGCMSHRVWESQVHALLEAGYRIITPDLRGHGDSDKPTAPYTAEMYADDLSTLATALGVDQFTLVGWSLGATVAATFARTYPDRLNRLGLVSSSIIADVARAATDDESESDLPLAKMIANQRRNRPRGMERFVAGMFGPEPDEWAIRWLWSLGMETPMRIAIKTLEIYADPDADGLRQALAGLEVPGAVFQGAHDGAATLDHARTVATDVFDDGTFVGFEESGHVPFLEESDRFNDRLRAFLDG